MVPTTMPDTTMCTGEGCEEKQRCYRFRAPADPHWQSYFEKPPVKNGECDYFWDIDFYVKGE
jgi:hypothetical protein